MPSVSRADAILRCVSIESAQRALADFSELGEEKGAALARLFAGAARGMLGDATEAESNLRSALDECRGLGARRGVAARLRSCETGGTAVDLPGWYVAVCEI